MSNKLYKIFLFSLFSVWALGQSSPAAPSSMIAPASAPQSVSITGILPVFGIEMGTDNSAIDGDNFPSQSAAFPNSGVSASFQKSWDAVKPGGFNLVRVQVDLSDPVKAATQAANLCSWAHNNNVKLGLVLRAPAAKKDYSKAAANFTNKFAALLSKDSNTNTIYDQLAQYELDPDWNNPSIRKNSSDLQSDLIKTASAIRKAQQQATGLSAKPVVVGASLDYEMIVVKGIAGVPFDAASYQRAYSSLADWLKPVVQSSDVDAIEITWLPGTITAGNAENLSTLISAIGKDLPGKPYSMRTGFSTAFHSADEQRQFYMSAFSALANARVQAGTDSKFSGVIFESALNSKAPKAKPDIQSAMTKWDWASKADELAAMWRDDKNSADMAWWLASVNSGLGLVNADANSSVESATAKPGLDALVQIGNAISASAASMPASTASTSGVVATTASSTSLQGSPSSDPNAMSGTLATAMVQNSAPAGTPSTRVGDPSTMGQMQPNSTLPGAMNTQPGSAGMTGTPGQPSSNSFASAMGQTFQSKTQQGLASMLDTVFQKLTTSVANAGSGGHSSNGYSVGMGNSNTAYGSMGGNTSSSFSGTDPNSMGGMNSMGAMGTSSMGSGADPNMNAGMSGMNSIGMNTPSTANGMIDPNMTPNSGMGGMTAPAPAMNTMKPGTPATGGMTAGVTTSGTQNSGAASTSATPVPRAANVNSASSQLVSTYPAKVSPTAGPAKDTSVIAANNSPSGGTAPPNAAAPVPSTTAPLASAPPVAPPVAQVPAGFAQVGVLSAQGNLVAGQPVLLTLPITNPNAVALSNIHAVLMIDGKAVQTQTLASLQPQQTLSMQFPQIAIAQPGSHAIKIGMQLQRGDSKPQMGMFTQSLVVQPGLPVAKAAVGSAATNRIAKPEASLATSDITYSPSPVSFGQTVNFRVVVRNGSDVPAKSTLLVLRLFADGKLVAATQAPIQFALAAKGTYQANWNAAIPQARQVELIASVSADGVETPGKSQVTVPLKIQALPATAPVVPSNRTH